MQIYRKSLKRLNPPPKKIPLNPYLKKLTSQAPIFITSNNTDDISKQHADQNLR